MTNQTSPEVQEIELEQWSARHPDQPPPHCRRYRIRVDRKRYVVQTPEITGRELLELAEKEPAECFALYQQFRAGHRKRIGLDERVDLRRPGIERFKTLPVDAKDGERR